MQKKIFLFFFLIFFLISIKTFALPPTNVSIELPANGASFKTGDAVTFVGNASDPEDGTLTGNSLKWFSHIDGILGEGSTITYSRLKEGSHQISLVAEDSEGNTKTAQIKIQITNPPPEITITSPLNNSTYTPNNTISFNAEARDEQDGPLTGSSIQWRSDKDGVIGTGEYLQSSKLTTGTHIITAKATDSHGASTEASVTISIINNKPKAEILSPKSGDNFDTGKTIIFEGRGSDNEDGIILDNSLVWTSSINGPIGSGPSISTDNLSKGLHTISLTVRDSNGLISDPETITINIVNSPPVPQINSPANNCVFQDGDIITFSGKATDPEDGNISGKDLVWSSNHDGKIGTGNEIKISNLSAGLHIITLTATDNDKYSASTQISIIAGNKSPVPEIITPLNNEVFLDTSDLELSGKATDYEDGILTGSSLQWKSSKDGVLGTGTSLTISSGSGILSTGKHVITLTATDSYGASESVIATIFYGNTPPVTKILTPSPILPESEREYESGQDVIFYGTASDREDGDLTGSSLVWSTNNEGLLSEIGTGNSFKINTLKSGNHKITLKAKDSGGAESQASVDIFIKKMFADKSYLFIEKQKNDSFEINGGIPPFNAFSSRNQIASAEIDGLNPRKVIINAKLEGNTTIAVTDKDSINILYLPVKVTKSQIIPPEASAFLKKNGEIANIVSEGDYLMLDASESNDPDGNITLYEWELISGPIPVYLDNKNSVTPHFTAPPVSNSATFVMRLTITDNEGIKNSQDLQFIIREKDTPFTEKQAGLLPVKVDNSKYMRVKYTEGLIKVSAKPPGSDTRNRPEKIPYELLEMEKKIDSPAINSKKTGNVAQFIVYLPEKIKDYSWYQENNYKGWQNMSESPSPNLDGAFFNFEKNQVFITIQDNGKYDLNPNENIVKTLSGLGLKKKQEEEKNEGKKKNSSSSGSGGCFIRSLFL